MHCSSSNLCWLGLIKIISSQFMMLLPLFRHQALFIGVNCIHYLSLENMITYMHNTYGMHYTAFELYLFFKRLFHECVLFALSIIPFRYSVQSLLSRSNTSLRSDNLAHKFLCMQQQNRSVCGNHIFFNTTSISHKLPIQRTARMPVGDLTKSRRIK